MCEQTLYEQLEELKKDTERLVALTKCDVFLKSKNSLFPTKILSRKNKNDVNSLRKAIDEWIRLDKL